jgi:hypothetical protein
MTTKHTPGPWKVAFTETGSQYIDAKGKYDYGVQAVLVVAEDCEAHPVADASCNWTCRDGAECEANARLIAAAPDLLAALQEILGRYDEDNLKLTVDAIQASRAAVKKAVSLS